MNNGLLRPPKKAGAARRAGLAAATAMLAGLAFAASAIPAHAEQFVTETFAGATAPAADWTVTSLGTGSDVPCLTAASTSAPGSLGACTKGATDEPGSGVFRLTDNVGVRGGNGGAIMLNKPVDARRGLSLEFDTYQWDAVPYNEKILGPRGGDGISFYLVDGSAAGSVGRSGGSLGYQDLKGAIVGVGFDEYGNFSNPKVFNTSAFPNTGGPAGCNTTTGGAGCVVPNAVVVRGAASTGYSYVSGKQLSKEQPLAVDSAKDKNLAKRHVVVDISTKSIMTVSMRFADGGPLIPVVENLDLNKLPNQPALPDTIKVGWAASTGAATANHAIGGFQARSLDADATISLTNDGPWKAGDTGSYTAVASASGEYGYIDDPLKVVVDVPAGVKPTGAAGEGWTCAIDGQKVTCDSTQQLAPGEDSTPVKIDVAVAKDTPGGKVTANASVEQVSDIEGGTEIDTENNTAASDADIEAAPVVPPALTTVVSGDDYLMAGEEGTVTLTTSNAPEAGPTNGTVTWTYTAGPGTTPVSAEGEGWTCEIDGQKVTCTRPGTGEDTLKPGDSYPPVNVVLKAAPDVTDGTSEGSVTTGVEGGEPTTTPVPIKLGAPEKPKGELDVDIKSSPNPYAPGKPYTYTVTVTNPGATDVKGAKLTADWPTPWDNIKWTCTSKGGACPAASGTGDLNETVDLAAGGVMTYTVTCKMPAGASESYTASATVTAADTNCTGGCTATDENAVAAARKAKKK